MRRELAVYVHDECRVVSTNSMDKIWYDTLAVSQDHQIQKICLSDDALNYPDYDFPLPYKTIPDGVMILSNNNDDDLFIEDNLITNLLKNNKNQLTELEIKVKEIPQ